MAKLTDAMKEMIANQQCYVATVDENGYPNIGPKRSTRVLDDSTILFTEGTGKQTYQNLVANSKVAIAVSDRDALDGFRFVGKGEVQEEGPLYDQAVEMAEKMGMAKPRAIVKMTVEAIYSLKPSSAGERIA